MSDAYYQKLRESGEDLCFRVTYQTHADFAKYARQYHTTYVKAKTEAEASQSIKTSEAESLREVIEVRLTGLWSSFESDLSRTYQGD